MELDVSARLMRDFSLFISACPDAKYRNGKNALVIAQVANNRAGKYANWEFKSTLAAAIAETGDYDRAVREQKVVLADKSMHADDTNEQEAQLKLY